MNPFQPPADDSPPLARPRRRASGYWVEGRILIAEKGAALPDLCLYSGKPTEGGRVTKKLVWAPPALAILIVISVLIYIIVYFIVRKTGTLEYALSAEARSRRTSGVIIAVGGFFVGMALIVASVDSRSGPMLIVATVLLLATLIVGLLRSQVVRIAKIDDNHIHLRLTPEAAQAFSAALAR